MARNPINGSQITRPPNSNPLGEARNRIGASIQQSGNIILGTVGNAVGDALSTAASAVVSPVLGGISQQIGQIGGPAAGVINALTGGGLGGLLAGLIGGFPPWPNELEKFASFNYIITLSCLNVIEFNLPDWTYRLYPPRNVICRSGGAADKTKTFYEVGGVTEYYIDDLEIVSMIAMTPAGKQSLPAEFTFKIYEPYSMGMFMQNLQTAALLGGHKNYLEAPFLLTVEFKGWDERGRSVSVPKSKRMFAIKMADVTFTVDEGGSSYDCIATKYPDHAFSDQVQQVNTDIVIQGRTVEEVLQSGGQSLTTVLNTRLLNQQQSGQLPGVDSYVIMFPTENSSAAESILGGAANDAGATTTSEGSLRPEPFEEERRRELFTSITGIQNGDIPANFDQQLEQILGLSVERSQQFERIRDYAQRDENINNIGLSPIVQNYTDAGTVPMAQPNLAENEDAPGTVDRSQLQIPDELRQFTFSQGTKIQDIIEEILLSSEWGRQLTDRLENPDANNMVEWFMIQTQVFLTTDTASVSVTGSSPKIYVFRVVPYMVNASRLSSPSTPQPNQAGLLAQAAKEYNYIYTGENKDILGFDIKFDAAFHAAVSADLGQLRADSQTGGQSEINNANTDTPTQLNQGSADTVSSTGSSRVMQTSRNRTGNRGGGGRQHILTNIVRDFNDALVNSNADLVEVDLKIMGDPYYLSDSGIGNYIASPTNFINILSNGAMDALNSEVDVRLNFRTPLDIGKDGWMDFPGLGIFPVRAFSGLYQVAQVVSSFSGGEFTQDLKMIRRRNQEFDIRNIGARGGNSLIQQGTTENAISPTNANQAGRGSRGGATSSTRNPAPTPRPQSRPRPTRPGQERPDRTPPTQNGPGPF